MCEICGGPHFTIRCPHSYSSGYSTDYYANEYLQPQPYQSYQPSYPQANRWFNPATSESLDRRKSRHDYLQAEMYEDRHGGSSSEYPPSQHLYPHPDYRDVSSHTRPDFAALVAKQQLMLEDIDSLLSKRTDSLREQDAALKRLEAQVDELKTIMDVEVPPPVQ